MNTYICGVSIAPRVCIGQNGYLFLFILETKLLLIDGDFTYRIVPSIILGGKQNQEIDLPNLVLAGVNLHSFLITKRFEMNIFRLDYKKNG